LHCCAKPEICHIVRVSSVQIDPDDAISKALARLGDGHGDGEGGVHELPTCPVCLERMDAAVTGLVTIPCSHTFHCMCLSKWGDSRCVFSPNIYLFDLFILRFCQYRCPVCRYSQSLLTTPTSSSSSRPRPIGTSNAGTSGAPLSQCADCASTTELWICLVCGNVGCGRYGRAHAAAHYSSTSHPYALELATQRVWDYARDGYVHRLIQNRADGKLVELPPAAMGEGVAMLNGGGSGPSEKDARSAEKLEAIGLEYSYLLTSQLESQREWYEDQTAALAAQAELLHEEAERARKALDEERAAREEERRLAAEEAALRVEETEKARLRAERRAEKLGELARGLEKDLKEERAVSEGLLKNMASLKRAAEEAALEREAFNKRVQELEEQVRDVMFFLEAKTKIEEGDGVVGEAAGGSIEVHTPTTPTSIRANGKKKKGKK
jgi:BRCA1-associated protein